MATMYLGAVMGWFLVIFSIFLIFRREHMQRIMEDVIAHPGLFFVFALMTLILGLIMVLHHNVWVMGSTVVITVMSWLVLISGLIRVVFPDTAMKMGKAISERPLVIQIIGGVFLVIGLFLLYHAY